jgi:hypothetical protein
MQTFLPSPDYEESAFYLDSKRLGKQRVETLQIMKALLTGRGWINHPATVMWIGYEWSLLQYQEAVCAEWTQQGGYKDTCLAKTRELYHEFRGDDRGYDPWWLTIPSLHISHQSNLIRKDPKYYAPQFPGVPPDLPYYWPIIKS